ncbi:hypothetical protein ZIOFF_059390 [Zingiber officinale]|uniref:Uncharacterized protein n=1 Tax=Zingiber officinale TaxID=94328 RepID=A0A8J5F9E3_ZINOF|nr:hypothetical protein ZIOFF_059390 [Zingiber officinale]
MEGKEEEVCLRDIEFSEMQPIGMAAQADDKHFVDTPPVPLFDPAELSSWSFYRAGIAQFMAIFLFLYITILTVTGMVGSSSRWSTVLALGGLIFALAYCTGGVSDGHINPAVTFGLFLERKLSLARALFYMVMQCLGAICGAGTVKWLQKGVYENNGSGTSVVAAAGYAKGNGLGAEILATFLFVCMVFYATVFKRRARGSQKCADPLQLVYWLYRPIDIGTGINPARSLGTAIIYDEGHAWDDHWIVWVGPFIGAALAALCRRIVVESRG